MFLMVAFPLSLSVLFFHDLIRHEARLSITPARTPPMNISSVASHDLIPAGGLRNRKACFSASPARDHKP